MPKENDKNLTNEQKLKVIKDLIKKTEESISNRKNKKKQK